MNISCKGKLIDLTTPKIMGVLNLTPDSFYDGGSYNNKDRALAQTEKMLLEGATFIDIGGASSKPGSVEISTDEELARVLPVIEEIHKTFPETSISIDTYRSDVAKLAVAAGAAVVNDISGGNLDAKMLKTVGALGVPYIAMHMQGTPQNMQDKPSYDNILTDIRSFFAAKIDAAHKAGIHDIIIDPGFGFGKTLKHNYSLLKNLSSIKMNGIPMLIGVSRKSMIYKLLQTEVTDALNGTTVLNTVALQQGAQILRVHDVKEAHQAVQLIEKLKYA
ncbi:MAG: dihydropteroate synthase [Flavobacteriaceae bacterium]|jgi:dihydropteroate synthase|nr:dihydropteroate synthase [Flavobacteriaceae bacterium]MDG2289809.1 dihydropteroate synthase [Flavobacteriaceae bacterium]